MTRPLKTIVKKRSGRNNQGKVTMRHQGGGEKKFLRQIDFKRDKRDITALVNAIEYDPNRGARIALLMYKDGQRRYILAPIGLNIGDQVEAGAKVEAKIGNALPLSSIPLGTVIHNLEIKPGKGGQMVRGAGTGAILSNVDDKFAVVKLPSGQVRKIPVSCYATVGQIGNQELKNRIIGKAGRKRHMGVRPTVRGVAQDPRSHPHGGGEGRSGIGMPGPKTPWGKRTLGVRTRKRRKYSDKFMIKR
jgi:large subunit ribosomal protein L2